MSCVCLKWHKHVKCIATTMQKGTMNKRSRDNALVQWMEDVDPVLDYWLTVFLCNFRKKMNVDEITIDPHAAWQPVEKEPDTCKDEEGEIPLKLTIYVVESILVCVCGCGCGMCADTPPTKKIKAEVTNPPTPVQRAVSTPPANTPCVKRPLSGINGTHFRGPTPPSSQISAPSPGRGSLPPVTRTASNTSLHDPTAVQLPSIPPPSIPPPSNPPPSNPPSGHQLAADDIDVSLFHLDSVLFFVH